MWPMLVAVRVEVFNAALGEEQVLVRVRLLERRQVAEERSTLRPRLVPMEPEAPRILRGFGIAKDRVAHMPSQVAVVIPHDDVLVSEALAMHDRAKMILEEFALLCGRVDHRLPPLLCSWLILDGDPPNREAFVLVGFDKFRVVECPCVVILGQQFPAVEHVLVALHECRSAPWAREQGERMARLALRALDHRNTILAIVLDRETLQR
mmetsp:Transcript_7448/g.12613  ORF Transcript_7448/g.12613 Transcript_7448/m.12613 type:complete len:208 (-) Transcript_7448:439-1062(-)